MSIYTAEIQKLYISYFNRPADVAGLAYWEAQMAAGITFATVQNGFSSSAEYQAIYTAAADNDALLNTLYTNIFGRAATTADKAYWGPLLVDGTYTINTIANTLAANAGTTDLAAILNKIDAAKAFTNQLSSTSETGYVTGTAGAYATASAWLATVGATDASLVAAVGTLSATIATAVGTPVNLGQTFTLTTSTTDTVIGTAGNDTITGATGTVAATDTIIDQTTTDSDTANLVVTAAYTPSNITKVENVNIDWNAFGTATVNTTAVTGASAITLTSSKVGFLGSSAITAGASQHLVAGTGMVGTMTVTGATTAVTVDATNSKIVSVTGTGIATVNAGASTTTVTTSGFTTATIDAGTATSVTITDGAAATDATALTVNGNATIANTITGTLAVTASADTLTMNTLATAGTTINGTGAIVINSTGLTGKTVTNGIAAGAGTLTFKSSVAAGAQDVSKVSADLIEFSAGVAAVITTKNNANIKLSGDAGAATLTVTGSGTADVLNVEVTGATQTGLIQAAATETVNLTANATAVSGTDLTLATYDTKGGTLKLLGTNDVSMTNVTTGGTIDASGLTGKLTVTQVAGATHNLAVTGGSGNLSVTGTSALTETLDVVGGAGDDTVITALATGAATATLAAGANTVTANALTTGTLVVNSGAGIDTVSTTALTTGTVVLDLSDGANVVSFGGTLAGATVSVTTGAGNDSVTITSATAATDTITLALGAGTNTLNVSTDDTAGTWTVSGLTTIATGTAQAAAKVNASLLTGKTYEITGDGGTTDTLIVEIDAAGTVDFSGIVVNQTITKGMAGLKISDVFGGKDTIVGSAFADTITAAAGPNTITGGLGADTIVGGAGADKMIFGAGDSGLTATTIDKITTAFTSGSDSISFGLAASATNYLEATSTFDSANVGGDAVATVDQLLAQANAALNGTVLICVIDNANANTGGTAIAATMSYAFYDSNADGTADMAIQIVGALTAVAQADFVA